MKLKRFLVLFFCLGYANSSSDGFESCSSSWEKSGRNVIAVFDCANNSSTNNELGSNDLFGTSLSFHCGNVNVAKTEVTRIILRINETCGVTEFPVEIFQSFNNLNELIITLPTLDPLDPWTFYSASKLTSFVVHGKNDMELPASLLAHVPQLKSFHTILTRFKYIHPEAFQYATNLEQLRITGAELTTLARNLLKGLTKLRILDLSWNKFTQVNVVDLTDCTGIETLDMRQNQITNLTDHSLDQMTGFKHLFLGENQISHIEPKTFWKMENLITLTLSHNKLERLAGDMFVGLINLKTLEVSHTEIQYIAADTFAGIGNLERLDLWGNLLTTLDTHIFDGLDKLDVLSLSQNKFQEFNVIHSLKQLSSLDLTYNNISELITEGGDHNIDTTKEMKLTQLNLSHNPIKTLDPKIFSRLVHLSWLDLSHCEFTSFDFGLLSHSTKLTVLKLTSNQLHSLNIPDSLPFYANLEWLRLNKNHLKHISIDRNKFPKMYMFDVSDNL